MANIARGKAECYISIRAECRVLYFPYSTWQGNDLSVIKNFLAITKHTNCANYASIHHVKSGQTHCVVTFTILAITVSAEENRLKSLRFFGHTRIRFYIIIIQHCSHLAVLYGKYSTVFAFDPLTQNSLLLLKALPQICMENTAQGAC